MITIEEYTDELETENRTLYADKNYWKRLAEKRKFQLQQKGKEIERLNNIINKFDKWLEVNLTNLEKEETSNIYNESLKQGMLSNGRLIKSKLQELKGDNSNE